jgi:hypothetical protein
MGGVAPGTAHLRQSSEKQRFDILLQLGLFPTQILKG